MCCLLIFFVCSAVTFPSSSTSSRRPEEVTLTCAPMGTPISESTQTQSPFHFNRKKNNRKRCIDIHSQLLLGYSFYEGDISMFSFSQVMIFPFIESQTRQRNDQGRLYDRQISRVLQTYPSQHHHNTAFLHNENKKQENSQFVEPPSVFHRLCCTSATTISSPVVKYSKLMEIEFLNFKQHNKRVLPHFKH